MLIRSPSERTFYVGYLPLPPGFRRVAAGLTVGLAAMLLLASALIASAQRSPGDGQWGTELVEIEGRIEAAPYPTIVPADGSAPLLVVEMGKLGGGQRALPLAGGGAVLTGYVIERSGRRMLELDAGESAVRSTVEPVPPPTARKAPLAGEPATLVGEIVDSKCYLGVMKPGDRAAHRACATLCIRGGIPPMFVVQDQDGAFTTYLLVTERGGDAGAIVLDHIGVPVRVTGMRTRLGPWDVIAISDQAIEPR